MIYIFVKNKFKFTEDLNNYLQLDYDYERYKENLIVKDNQVLIIDEITLANECLIKGFNTDDIILCVESENVYKKLKAQLYFCTSSFKEFTNYLEYIKLKLNV